MDVRSTAPSMSRDYPQSFIDDTLFHRRLRNLGIVISILILWNGVCDLIYGYSSTLSGRGYFSSAVWHLILTAGNRPHWMLLLAQSAGWLYPLYALSYLIWWAGMRRAGFWLGVVPNLLLAYAVLMIGGTQHTGWAFLSALSQAKTVVGSTDPTFYAKANQFLVEHFIMGDLTAMLALYIGTVWHAIGILSGKTGFPRWFVIVSPLGALTITMLLGVILPAPFAGIVLAPFGTWFLLVPTLAGTMWVSRLHSMNR